ncbi:MULTISPECIES: LPXTG cell wall anchor domain-containing protein [Gemella]|uniref:LPXTG cell wall anchor domain-containing protein n=1 Tax=Gemella TaxID=1378 RepID=UPI00352C2CC4
MKSTYFDELKAGDITGYTFDKTTKEDGITTHYFKKIKNNKPSTPNKPKQPDTPTPPKASAIPQDGVKNLSTDKPQLKVTRWVDENGKEIKSTYFDELKAGDITEYTFDKTTKEDGITTHHFKKIKYNKPSTPTPNKPKQPDTPTPPKASAIPQDGVKNLSTDKPQLKVTRWVDENDKEIKSTSSEELQAGNITGYTFDKTTKEDSITTHHFKKIKDNNPSISTPDKSIDKSNMSKQLGTTKPKDNVKDLITEKPQLKVTRWVNENGKELKPTKAGKLDAGEIKGYTFDETLEKNGITTHHYKKIKETFGNSTQSLLSNKNLMQGKTLPNTGQTSTQNTILELGLISALGLIARKKLSNK